MYVKKNGDFLQSMVMEEDLKFCMVKAAPLTIDRSSCFEVLIFITFIDF
jgi:hypothetical protein